MLKQPKRPGHPHKPTLTGAKVKELTRAVLDKKTSNPRRGLLQKDWRAFLRAEFHLSKTQEQNLRKIPGPEVERIQAALHQALASGGEVNLELPAESVSGSGSLTITGPLEAPSTNEARIVIPIIRCSFDADCGNWSCRVPSPF